MKGRFENEYDDLFGSGESRTFSESRYQSGKYSGRNREAEFSLESEIDLKFGKTVYLPIQLSKRILPKVGVFIPQGFQPLRTIKDSKITSGINIIVYLHGHIYLCDNNGVRKFDKGGIEYYWNTPGFTFLREELAVSGRNALLIAPNFTNKLNRDADSFGNLDENNKFDFLINECFSLLKNSGDIPGNSQVRNIILAGHSAGGLPMQYILCAKNSLEHNVTECWGFECLYFGTDIWSCWLNHNPDKNFIHYRRKSVFTDQSNKLKKHGNFNDVNNGKSHCGLVKEKWRTSIENSPSLQTGGFSGGFPDGKSGGSENREISAFGFDNNFENEFTPEKGNLYAGKITVAGLPKNQKQREKLKKSGGAYVEINESPSVFLLEILRNAKAKALKDKKNDIADKLNADDWFNQFTRDFTFLGRRLKEVKKRQGKKIVTVEKQYVHIEMAKLLKDIEAKFLKDLNISDAKKAGDILLKNSPEGISGSRLTSSTATFSMHMFGLAVDVNYLGNPYIQEGDIQAVNNVLRNAASLMNTELLTYRKHEKNKFADRYDYIQALDNTIENYFKLLDDSAALERYLQSTRSSEWRSLSVKNAAAKIQKNLDNLAGLLARKDHKDYFKKHAILDFDKRFVTGMENMKLHWGGDYGDMMHFDMRNTGVGYYVEKARNEYAAKVIKQTARLYKEKKYGEHPPE